jgi:hypothetical protein
VECTLNDFCCSFKSVVDGRRGKSGCQTIDYFELLVACEVNMNITQCFPMKLVGDLKIDSAGLNM